ncbi:DUF559 domain-containing protein [Bdellovibrio sp. HCB117]|uniref:DUF559 domain-containing protein n=1 Tax=Bdellovibrio sp. HCB117 TaxID=3394359 RepID=UPI0039B6B0C2
MSNLMIEVKQEESARARYTRRMKQLKYEYGLMKLNDWEALGRLYRRIKDRKGLSWQYEDLCTRLNRSRSAEFCRTPAEDKFIARFKGNWKIQLYPQAWIGNLCVDLFTPALGRRPPDYRRGFLEKGVAIEIDGAIHNSELKMKKDAHKEKSLSDLNIQLWRFTNEQVFRNVGLPKKHDLSEDFGRLSTQERKRLWGKIQLMTLLYHESLNVIARYFPGVVLGAV